MRETINKMKRQPAEWEKVFANYISNKRLMSKIYEELTQLNTKKILPSKMGRRHEQTFLQRRHPDGQETPEKIINIAKHQRNTSQNHKETPPHTRYHGYYQKPENNKCRQGCGETANLCTADSHRQYSGSLKT